MSQRSDESDNVSPPSVGALLLAALPFVGMCFTVALWDRVEPRLLGVPFNLCWLLVWIALSSLCTWGAYLCERDRSP
jgi:Protein of unknown function (DUF3311)